MPSFKQQIPTPLECLKTVIKTAVAGMDDLKKNPADFTRNRKMDAESTIKTILNMGGQSLDDELIDAFPELSGEERISEPGFEQQKAKLCPEIFRRIMRQFNMTMPDDSSRLLGGKYLVCAIDGSDFNLPWNPDSVYVVTNPSGRPRNDGTPPDPYCQVHVSTLYNCSEETYIDVVFQPKIKADEREAAIQLIQDLHPDKPMIVLMDRGYESLNLIQHFNIADDNLKYCIRMKCGNKALAEIAALPDEECDIDVDILVTTSYENFKAHKDTKAIHYIRCPKKSHIDPKNMTSATRYQRWDHGDMVHVKFRLVKFRIAEGTDKEKWEVIATNLPRDEFSAQKIKVLYHERWKIESSYRKLKYDLPGAQFHSLRSDFCEMELLAQMTMYNVVSRTVKAVDIPRKINSKHRYEVSFSIAATIVRKYFRDGCRKAPNDIYNEIIHYRHKKDSGPAKERNMKPKSAIVFWYRIA